MTIGGTREELALVKLGLQALVDRLDALGRARPPGLDDLRRHLSAVLSRPEPSSRDTAGDVAEGDIQMGPLLHPLEDAAERLGISMSTLGRVVKAGRLPVVHVGRRTLVIPADLERYVASLAEKEPLPSDPTGTAA